MYRHVLTAAAAILCLGGGLLTGAVPAGAESASAPSTIAGFTTVTDDTGTISVAVPTGWAVSTAPRPYWGFWEVVPALDYPTISASPTGSPDGSTLTVQAFPLSDPRDVLDSFYGDYGVDCDATGFTESPFGTGGGVLVGRQWSWPGCYAVERHTVIADYGTQFTVAVDYFAATASDAALFETIADSLMPTGSQLPTPTPAPAPATTPVTFPWTDFRSVPILGAEGVRGTGCGSAGQIGADIPDGWWAGFTTWTNDGTLGVDLLCVFSGNAAQQVLDDADDTVLDANLSFLVVNNSTRVRSVPINSDVLQAVSGVDAGGVCAPGGTADPTAPQPTMAWVHLAGGQVDYVFYDCPPTPATPPTPSNLPPAYPTGDAFAVWPYGEFWNVPQLGIEPVRGSGCGSQGEIAGTIPDGLWAGYVSLEPATDQLWVDLLCIYSGESAQSVLADGTATVVLNDPGYLIVNNNDQRRAVTNDLQAILSSATDASGRCAPAGASQPGPGQDHLTAPIAELDSNGNNQAWIRIQDGRATWMVYGCDTGFQPGG